MASYHCDIIAECTLNILIEYLLTCDTPDKAQLCLFGSSKNGFGFRDSDLDICMTLEGHDTAEVGW